MYKFAKDKLTKELEEKEIRNNELEKEKNKIIEKLEMIKDYDNLSFFQRRYITSIIILMVLAGLLGVSAVAVIVKIAGLGAKIMGIGLGMIAIFLEHIGKCNIETERSNAKEIQNLKQQGVEEYKKEEDELRNKGTELSHEQFPIQMEIKEISAILKHIDFFNRSKDVFFYQADTEKEYQAKLGDKLKYEQMFKDYLNEPVNYEDIHLEVTQLEDSLVRKLMK